MPVPLRLRDFEVHVNYPKALRLKQILFLLMDDVFPPGLRFDQTWIKREGVVVGL